MYRLASIDLRKLLRKVKISACLHKKDQMKVIIFLFISYGYGKQILV